MQYWRHTFCPSKDVDLRVCGLERIERVWRQDGKTRKGKGRKHQIPQRRQRIQRTTKNEQKMLCLRVTASPTDILSLISFSEHADLINFHGRLFTFLFKNSSTVTVE
jgi:hypothetical protein